MSASKACELLHRRSHMGHVKIKALPHSCTDAPKLLASAHAGEHPCAYCAQANIKKASHSGSLDTPADRPGKQFERSIQGFYYAAFFIDEHTRHVWVKFLKQKSELVQATELVVAEFNATVGVPILPGGVTSSRPEVLHIHSDHEGAYESYLFEDFRAKESIHHTMSPPHDHNLNPIAERTIGVISDLCKATKLSSGVPLTFWVLALPSGQCR